MTAGGHFRFYSITLGLLVCALASYRVWQLWTRPAVDTWTPASFAQPLETVADRFEVRVAGEPMTKVVADGKLTRQAEVGTAPVRAEDVTVRVNNADRQKAETIPPMLAFAAVAGGAFVLFVIGLFTPVIGSFHPRGLVDLHLET